VRFGGSSLGGVARSVVNHVTLLILLSIYKYIIFIILIFYIRFINITKHI